jgi:hypothetical protein
MSEKPLEKSEMSSVEFVQYALRDHVAPPSIGSVKARWLHAARSLKWSVSRVKDAWYADPRISISADEIRKIEEKTGLRYGREELRSIEELIGRADAILAHTDEDFHRPFLAALRAVARLADRSRTEI